MSNRIFLDILFALFTFQFILPVSSQSMEMKDIKTFSDFASDFNSDNGKVRIVALLSPT